jgi:acetylornithine deacetylase/succinyl-diaminopimelate desuccinylase-like protein
MNQLDSLKQYFDKNQKELLETYFDFLKFKTISALDESKEEMEKCVKWLKSHIEEMGLKVSTWRSFGHPVIFAETKNQDPKKPTWLIYNHYDVQPVDPLDLWESPPFEPTLREGKIFARGAADNKGQCFYVYSALKAYKMDH